ncbi:long-chain fatty acid transport protein 2-like isoform X1 [Mytilus californianus]|uniref:long-chain fatty acid transport protein 2-like isoform X1 n=2 Tax=Mytilus californianus TaxID=6549 RepID=UPI002246CAD0|nr:long-chain fatty acid transport protein 2-like isoform X1 [Mytilus californianus]
MSNAREKSVLAAFGMTGLSLVAWKTMFPWIQYDLQSMKTNLKVAKYMSNSANSKGFVIDNFETTVARFPKKTYIICDDRCYTFEYVNSQACKVANIVMQWDLNRSDAVAIFVHNSAEYIWTFLGLLKIGFPVTLLNINVRGKSLSNAIQQTDTKAIIVGQGEDLYEAISEIRNEIDIPVYVMGMVSEKWQHNYQSWDLLMMTSSPVEISQVFRSHIDMHTIGCYILTSGTTGLPKAVRIPHFKLASCSRLMRLCDLQPEDVLYTVLPFYHVAGISGWLSGAEISNTVVIRKKFSANHFWDDCRKYHVTVVQYIGELCRYMLALPENPKDGTNNIKCFIGNGLRQDIWLQLQKRFKIPKFVEVFGATEATGGLVNVCNRPGAVGRISPLMNKLDPAPKYLLKYDVVTANPLRNKLGRCMEVQIGEPGILICGIPPSHQVEKGLYKGNMEMTEKKIVRNVFKEGDAYFNFGDSLYLDKDYFAYFHDRVGDTFRWKGENVSTTEVSNIISQLPFILDANVYGVSVPGHDGKAGMVSLTLMENIELTAEKLQEIYTHCEKELPRYARPLVLRIEKDMRTTSTYKQHKVTLMKEGFDPNVVSDPMFYLSAEANTYLPLNSTNHHLMIQAKL